MSGMFERAELLADVSGVLQGPPLLLDRARPARARPRCSHAAVDALAAEGWRPVYLDLLAAATLARALRASRAGRAARRDWPDARPRGRAKRTSSRAAGGGKGRVPCRSLLSAWAALDTVDGRPIALLLDEATEIRSLAYFSGLREVDGPFGAALAARPRGTLLATSFPGVARKLWPQLATLAMPPLSAAELQGEARRRGLRVDGSALAAPSFGWPRLRADPARAPGAGQSLATAWAEEMALGGRLEQACRHTYEVLLLRSRGYGMSKAVLAAVAAEEGLNLTALVVRLGRTPGAIRDYLGWLLAVDALRTTRKRYYYVDGVLRLWVRLHARGVRASERRSSPAPASLLAAAAPAPPRRRWRPRPRHQGLMEID